MMSTFIYPLIEQTNYDVRLLLFAKINHRKKMSFRFVEEEEEEYLANMVRLFFY